MQASFVTSRGNDLMESKGVKYVVYALVIGIVLAVTLIVADMFVPFLPVNPVGGASAMARTGKTFWPENAENLIVPSNLSPTLQANIYTMSFQLMIADSRTTGGKFRHVVHRGSDPCNVVIPNMPAGPSGHSGILASDISTAQFANGLPSIMNPGIFLDEIKNDLHIFIQTTGSSVLMLEGCTVYDLPLKTPISIGIVCNHRTVEVYVNCLLYQTILLKGTPYLPAGNNQWFGRYCAFPMSGIVQNLQLWPVALTSADFMQMCKTPSIEKEALPTCMKSS